MSRLSWKAKLGALFALVLSASLLVQVFYVMPYIRNREAQMAYAHQEEIARSIAREADVDLKRFRARLANLAARPALRNMDIANLHGILASDAEGAVLGTSLFVMGAEGCSAGDDLAPYTTQSYRDRPFFAVPFEQGQVYFGLPRFYSREGIVSTSAGVPIESEEGKRVGVLIGGLNLNPLAERVADYPLDEGTVAYVVDSEGTVVAHSEMDLFALEEGPLSLNYSECPMVQAVMAGEAGRSQEYEHDGTPYFGASAVLAFNDWGVIVEAPESVILAGSRALGTRLLLVNLGLCAVAFAVTLVFTQQIATQRERAEREMGSSESRFKDLFDNMSNGVAVYEARNGCEDFVIVDFNRAGERLDHAKRKNVIGKSVCEVFPGIKEFGLFEVLQRVWRTGQPVHHPVSLYQDQRIAGWRENYVYKMPSGEVVSVYDDITERKRAEEALAAERNLLRTLIDNLPDYIFVKDAESRFITANAAHLRTFGARNLDEVVGKTDFDLFPRELAEQYYADERRVISSGEPLVNREELGLDRDAHEQWLLTTKVPLRDATGCVVGLVGIARDITERKRVEEALKESEQRYRAQFDEALDAIFIADAKTGILTDCNRAAEELVHRAKSDLIGKHQNILHPPGPSAGELSRTFKQHVGGKEGRSLDAQVITSSGEIRDVSIKANLLDIGGRKVLQGIFHDITERKRAEEALRESEERFRVLFELAPDAYYLSDLKGTFIDGNKAAERIIGYERDQLIGQSFLKLKLLSPKQIVKAAALVARNVLGRPTGPDEFVLNRKDGTRVPVEISTVPVKIGSQAVVLGIARDITERKRAEEMVRHRLEMERLVGRLSNRFINVPFSQVDDEITHTIEALGQFAGADRSYVFLLSDDGAKMDNTHEWCAQGIEPQMENLQGLPSDTFPWWMAKLRRFENVAIPRVKDLPPEASVEREILQSQDIQSLIVVPLTFSGALIGFLGLDSVRAERIWPEEDTTSLRTLGNVLASALEHRRAEETLRQSEERHRNVVELVGEGILIADPTEQITFANPAVEGIFGVEADGLVGRNLSEFLDPDQLAIMLNQAELRRAGVASSYEMEITRPDGDRRSLLVTATSRADRESHFTGALGVLRDITERKHLEEERERMIVELREALAKVRTLSGLLPICANCKKIRTDQGYWQSIESYIGEHSEAEFTHGLCPDCMKKLYPEYCDEDGRVLPASETTEEKG